MRKKYIVNFVCICVFMTLVACQRTQPHWNTVLKQDSKLSSGFLPNGMKYLIYPTHTQPERVSLRLLVDAGAAMETDDEDGIAHFIEHMSFNGTTHFKPGTLIHWFKDNGMGFGNDTNAFTSYLHTCYQIDLPKNDEDSLQKGLLVLRDQAFGCLFLQEEIDRERGVILSEMRARDSAKYQEIKAFYQWIGEGTFWSNHFIIGTEATLKKLNSNDFFSFYRKWYNPQRMTVVVTGDCSPKKMFSQLKKAFQNKNKNQEVAPFPELQFREPKENPEVLVYKHKDLSGTHIAFYSQKNIPSKVPTLQAFKDHAAWDLIKIIIEQRLEELKNKTCLAEVSFEHGIDFGTLESTTIAFSGDADAVKVMVGELEKFTRNIHTFGFSQQELDAAKRIFVGKYKLIKDAEQNATPRELAESIIVNLIEKDPILSAQQCQKHFEQVQTYITAEYCERLWKEMFNAGAFLFVSTPDENIVEKDIKQYFFESQQTVLEIPQQFQNMKFQPPFKQLKASKIQDRHFFQKTGVETLRLDNNVRINLKKTDIEKNRIWINVNLGNGLLDFVNTPYPGLNLLLSASFISGGLQQMEHNALKRIFDGKCISLDFDVEDDSYTFKCVTDNESLLEQLQLICAYLLEPGYREEAVLNFRKIIPSWFKYFEHDCDGVRLSKVVKFLVNGDVRYGYNPKEDLLQRNFKEAKEILDPVFEKAYMEVTVIGDFEQTKIIKYLQETLGQLNERESVKSIPENARTLLFPEAQTKQFFYETETDKSMICVVWPTESVWNMQHRRALVVLRDILSDRLLQSIRQTQGDTYSPHVQNIQSELFKNRGYMRALLTVAPEKVDSISDQILKIADDMATQGVTQIELERAVKPIASSLEQFKRTNRFWMDWLKNLQQYPEKQTWDIGEESLYSKLTLTEVNTIAKKYLRRNTAICVQIKPENKEK
jgi:zinc protease